MHQQASTLGVSIILFSNVVLQHGRASHIVAQFGFDFAPAHDFPLCQPDHCARERQPREGPGGRQTLHRAPMAPRSSQAPPHSASQSLVPSLCLGTPGPDLRRRDGPGSVELLKEAEDSTLHVPPGEVEALWTLVARWELDF